MVSKGIVHRDLKPQNILLSHDGRSKNPLPQDITLKIGENTGVRLGRVQTTANRTTPGSSFQL
jgi:serine/threonine protein kinase